MSWQAYVDQSLVGSGAVDKASIINAEGTSVWATSAGFTVSAPEMKEIVASYADKGDANGVKQVQSTGIHVAGQKYIVLKADERSLYGKQGKTGIAIVKTSQAILIAHYPESVQPGAAATVVEQLGDYLIKQGY